MTLTKRLLNTLPATLGEIASILGHEKHRVNAILYWQKLRGRVKRSNRYGMRDGTRGRKPALWVRI